MRIISTKDYDHMSRQAANLIASQIILQPASVLGLATGSSPVGTYQQLIERYNQGDVDFSQVKAVNLDEYVGLSPDNDQSYAYFMRSNLFDHVNINLGNTHIPNGLNPDAEDECARYDSVLQALGCIDLQLLGLGPNGHIGFNEPDRHFSNGTQQVPLTHATIQANKRFFTSEDKVPRFAYTIGVGHIMRAKRVVMVVSGSDKAGIVKAAFSGPVTPQVPASLLQFHSDFTLVADQAALSQL